MSRMLYQPSFALTPVLVLATALCALRVGAGEKVEFTSPTRDDSMQKRTFRAIDTFSPQFFPNNPSPSELTYPGATALPAVPLSPQALEKRDREKNWMFDLMQKSDQGLDLESAFGIHSETADPKSGGVIVKYFQSQLESKKSPQSDDFIGETTDRDPGKEVRTTGLKSSHENLFKLENPLTEKSTPLWSSLDTEKSSDLPGARPQTLERRRDELRPEGAPRLPDFRDVFQTRPTVLSGPETGPAASGSGSRSFAPPDLRPPSSAGVADLVPRSSGASFDSWRPGALQGRPAGPEDANRRTLRPSENSPVTSTSQESTRVKSQPLALPIPQRQF